MAALVGLFFLPSPWGVLAVAGAAVIEFAEVAFWIRFLGRYRVRTGAEGLIGELAEVVEPCAPKGRVRLHGELWNARSEAHLDAGKRARVTALEGLTLLIEPEATEKGP